MLGFRPLRGRRLPRSFRSDGLQGDAPAPADRLPHAGELAAAGAGAPPPLGGGGSLRRSCARAAGVDRSGSSTTARPTRTGTSTWGPRSTRSSRTSWSSRGRCSATMPCTCRAGTATGFPSSTRSTRSSGSTRRGATCAARWIRPRSAGAAGRTRCDSSTSSAREFRRLGVFGDWTRPYLTMAPAYQATIVREFGRFVGRGSRLQGTQARPLVHALQDGARAGGGRVRGASDPVGLREVPAGHAAPRAGRCPAPVGRHLDDDAVDPPGEPGRRGESEREVRGARHGRRDADRRGRARRCVHPGGPAHVRPPPPDPGGGRARGARVPAPVDRAHGTGRGGVVRRRWTPGPASSTSPRATARKTTSWAAPWGCRSTTRSTTTAASSRRSPTSPGSPCGTRIRGSSPC